MGVTGLWKVVEPCGRKVRIETLNKKRLAVDASIWIYQFLKAVRDKEGNALRNSHVVGFFRRICKLLFFGIKPIFVFDGGAPALKRQTITSRKSRREGRREDAVRTAGKLLAVNMARRAEEEEKSRKTAANSSRNEEEPIPENLTYVEEIEMTQQERQQTKKFKKKDAYHLPDLGVSMAEMGAPNDPRIMSLEELEQYARQFEQGEDISIYDFSKIDFDSAFFTSLPAADRYNILNAARLRSRLRLGYSKEQLDTMFPDRMAFSKFQIERVKERNELTQRLMNINGMNELGMSGVNGTSRVAGERGREYVLVKNDGVEGGWALGVVSNKDEGERNQPINVEELDKPLIEDDDENWEDEDDFEDVPIEGLNRLPKQRPIAARGDSENDPFTAHKPQKQQNRPRKYRMNKPRSTDPDSLFMAEDSEIEHSDKDDKSGGPFVGTGKGADSNAYNEEDELQQAIAMSLQNDAASVEQEDEGNEYEEVFKQAKVDAVAPFAGSKGGGLAIARMANSRSSKAASAPTIASDDEDVVDLQAALAASRRTRSKKSNNEKDTAEVTKITKPASPQKEPGRKFPGFDGPLPFEKLDLGTSLLGKKKMKQIEEDQSGGFEKGDNGPKKKKNGEPLPPWFAGNLADDLAASKARDDEDRKQELNELPENMHFEGSVPLRRRVTHEVIDLDAPKPDNGSPIIVDSSDEQDAAREPARSHGGAQEKQLLMDDIADELRAEPPMSAAALSSNSTEKPILGEEPDDAPLDWEESDQGELDEKDDDAVILSDSEIPDTVASEDMPGVTDPVPEALQPVITATQRSEAKSPSPDFEDVPMRGSGMFPIVGSTEVASSNTAGEDTEAIQIHQSRDPSFDAVEQPNSNADTQQIFGSPPDHIPAAEPLLQELLVEDDEDEDGAMYSDPEDEELFRQLAAEAEEHARFASTFNNRTQEENVRDYERELQQLRNQQKKDRRDADEVTQTMITECQQLLSLFGLPYITAPMEAEAQCAELVHLSLVDGIVTDDSDIFLFGGNRVFKNMFNQAKNVECYLQHDIVGELGLDRQKLTQLAQILGSDYTEGLPGIGHVGAVELMSEFGDLQSFKNWWTQVQAGTWAISSETSSFRKKFRRTYAKKLFLPPAFPDLRVEAAYLKPDVDSDPSQFAWGVPDLDALRNFLMATIGWTRERTDEVLVPVIKDMNRRETEGTQANITEFFDGGVGAGAFAPRRREVGGSKRLASALNKMRNRAREDTRDEKSGEKEVDTAMAEKDVAPTPKGRDAKRKKAPRQKATTEHSGDSSEELYVAPKRKARKTTGKKRASNTGDQV